MAVFFTSLLPQFAPHFAAWRLLGLVFCAMTFLWLACYTLALAGWAGCSAAHRIRRALDALTGRGPYRARRRLATEQP